jgi:hypothetical protein
MEHLLLFHSNNGFVNTSHCYVMCTLPLLFGFINHNPVHQKYFKTSMIENGLQANADCDKIIKSTALKELNSEA